MDCALQLRVVPHAKKSEVTGLMDDGTTWKIRLAAPPVEGKANEALIRWLASALDLPRRNLALTGGEKSRAKRVLIQGADLQEVTTKLQALAELSISKRAR